MLDSFGRRGDFAILGVDEDHGCYNTLHYTEPPWMDGLGVDYMRTFSSLTTENSLQ